MAVTAAIIGASAALLGGGAAVAGAITSGVQGKKANDNAQKQLDNSRATEKFNLEQQLAGIDTDILETKEQIISYDQWLSNYGSQYAQEVQSKQAQTDALNASGRETYENFLNAIGYADAAAGASGRVGAGTSQAHTTSMIDRKLVDYVGADRTLDATGGLFGSQLTAANMEMGQLKADLQLQKQQVETDRRIAEQSLTGFHKAKGDLQDFLDRNFP